MFRFSARAILIPLYGSNILNLTSGEIGFVLSASTLTNVLMVVPGGYVVDRYGRKRGLVPAFIFTGLAFALFPASREFSGAFLTSLLLGVASGLGGGATMALAADLSPADARGFFLGFWNAVGDLGNAIGPVILGLTADIYGMIAPFYLVTFLMLLSALTTQLFVKETVAR
jgi:MFS family permease